MNKTNYLLTLFLLLTLSARSEAGNPVPDNNNSLSGKVLDADTRQPLIGATVFFPDLKVGGVTGPDGAYQVKFLPKGTLLVEVRYIGYKTFTESVNVQGDGKLDFVLSPTAVEQGEVVVTGLSRATEIRRSPVPLVAIGHRFLEQNMSSNIIESLTKVPGISAVTTGPNISKPFIRGLGYDRVLTLYDGMRQEGQQWGDEHGIEVDEYNVDHVEIVKGPASLAYGSGAMAGVINLIPTQPPPPGYTVGNILQEYQTNDGLIGTSLMFAGNKRDIFWLVRGSHKMSRNYQDPIDGRVYGTNFRESDLYFSTGINRSWGYSHLEFSLYDDLQAIPDGSRDSISRRFTKQITEADTFRPIVSEKELNSYSLPLLHQHVQHYRLLSSSNLVLGRGNLDIKLGVERSVRREFSHPQYPSVPGLFLVLNSYVYDIKYLLPDYGGWDFTAGLGGMYQTNLASRGTDFIIPNFDLLDAGLFTMFRKSFNRLDVSGGLRWDNQSFNNKALFYKPNPVTEFDQAVTGPDTLGSTRAFYPFNQNYSGFTGSLGFTYNFTSQLSIKANMARGFRAPDIAEISANGVHPGTNIYQIGNLDFKPEFNWQEDIGADFTTDHLSLSISLFDNRIQHFIFDQKVLNYLGQDSIIVPGNQTFKFEASNAELYGGEFSLDIHPHPLDWLHFENSVSLVYGLNRGAGPLPKSDTSKYLPDIPPVHGISELRANIKRISRTFQNAFFKIQAAIFAAQNRAYLAYNTETPTPGYTLINLGMGTGILNKSGVTLFNVSLFINNLFNVAYQDHLSRLKYMEPYPNDPRGHLGIYNMGRNLGIRVIVPFQWKKG